MLLWLPHLTDPRPTRTCHPHDVTLYTTAQLSTSPMLTKEGHEGSKGFAGIVWYPLGQRAGTDRCLTGPLVQPVTRIEHPENPTSARRNWPRGSITGLPQDDSPGARAEAVPCGRLRQSIARSLLGPPGGVPESDATVETNPSKRSGCRIALGPPRIGRSCCGVFAMVHAPGRTRTRGPIFHVGAAARVGRAWLLDHLVRTQQEERLRNRAVC
jgi:hypothetical protein